MPAGFIVFLVFSIIVLVILLIYCVIDEEWFPLQCFLLGWLFAFTMMCLSDETSQSVAEEHNIDYALVEAIAEVTDEIEYDVAVTLSVAGTENIEVVFNLTDEEMTAIKVLLDKEK